MGNAFKMGIWFLLSLMLIAVDCLLLFFTEMEMIPFWIIFAISIIIMIVPFTFIRDADISMDIDSVHISAPFVNLRIPFNTIQAVEFRESFHPGMRTYGMFMIKKGSGNFSNKEFGHYKFTGTTAIPGFVVIRYDGNKTVVFNVSDKENTNALYSAILSKSKANDEIAAIPGIEEKLAHDRKVNIAIMISVFAVFAAVLAITIGVVCFAGHVDATLNADDLYVNAVMVDERIQYTDITYLELRENFDCGYKKSGFDGFGYRSGKFNNTEFGNYTLAIHTDVNRYIVVTYGSGEHLVFNVGSNDDTTAFYNKLGTRM